MKWYYLATLIWILEILMFISIIFIPAVLYLRDSYWWFYLPFFTAQNHVIEIEKENKYEQSIKSTGKN